MSAAKTYFDTLAELRRMRLRRWFRTGASWALRAVWWLFGIYLMIHMLAFTYRTGYEKGVEDLFGASCVETEAAPVNEQQPPDETGV